MQVVVQPFPARQQVVQMVKRPPVLTTVVVTQLAYAAVAVRAKTAAITYFLRDKVMVILRFG
jgi:hypothetical protein